MEEEKQEEKKLVCKNLINKSEEKIEQILNQEGITKENVIYLGNVVDILKDTKNIEFWKEKIEMMYRGNYSNYSNYDGDNYGRRGVPGTGRGRYRDGENYGRRGVPGTGRSRYRGEDVMNDMYESYQNYSYGRENYGHDEGTMKSLKYMLDSVKEFMKTLEEDATSQEEVEMIKRTAREISER